MKIVAVDTYLLSLPYRTTGGFHYIAGRPSSALSMLLVRVSTEDGLSGWGEAFAHAGGIATKAMLDTLVAPLLINEDSSNIFTLMEMVRRKIHLFGLSGPAIYAVSGIDIALWDLLGKRKGKSVSELLGGRSQELSVYASFLRCSSEDALKKTCEDAIAQGYLMVKLHEITLDRIALARRSLGPDVELAVDTNCPWTVDEAKRMLDQVQNLNLLWLEEPLWPPDDYAGLQKLRNRGTPISAGENTSSLKDFGRLLTTGAVDVLQPSVCKVGGITEMLKIIALTEASGIKTVPHCGYMGLGYCANLHLISGLGLNVSAERLFIDLEVNPFITMPAVTGGRTATPSGPGLGCDPDMDIVKKYLL
jgi:L-alanine-DL-glutamate epimerase-like enolase superfamily enzyme